MSVADQFNELEPKQKVTLMVTLVLGIVFIYLVYDTFFAGSDISAPEPQPAPTVQRTQSPPPSPTPNRTTTTTTSAPPPQVQASGDDEKPDSVQQVAPAEPTPEQLAIMQESQELQKKYLTLVNEFQLAQLQQKLEAANASIASSRLKTATTQAQTAKLESQLKKQQAQFVLSQQKPKPDPEKTAAPTVQEFTDIQVVYVGEKNGKWMAMMNLDGSYFEVRTGTQLPDGAVVDLINEKGVVLEKNYKKQYFRVPRSLD